MLASKIIYKSSLTLPSKHVLNVLFTQEVLLYAWLQIYGNDIFFRDKANTLDHQSISLFMLILWLPNAN